MAANSTDAKAASTSTNTSSPAPTNALISLGKSVYLTRPIEQPTSLDESKPNLILIFGWMGAKLPHLLKYLNKYDELYPGATKILVRSEATFFWSSTKQQNAAVFPAVEALAALGYLPPLPASKPPGKVKAGDGPLPINPALSLAPTPRVLVHTFSNGGSWQLATLGNLIAAKYPKLPSPVTTSLPSALVLDSCPGNGGLKGTLRAFTSSIHNPVVRPLAQLFVVVWYTLGTLSSALARLILRITPLRAILRLFGVIVSKHPFHPLEAMKEALNSPTLLPWLSTARTKRLYQYSETDRLIPASEVEKHAADARAKGWEVRMEKYETSAHVAHAREHPERYWGAISRVWEEAVADKTT